MSASTRSWLTTAQQNLAEALEHLARAREHLAAVSAPAPCPECSAEPVAPGALIGDRCAARDLPFPLERRNRPALREAAVSSKPARLAAGSSALS